ncbi:hypothetical protein INS88_01105 [Trueperella pecoris]|uniref:Lipoprotein n=4 Tax=Trueperella pecoris TaxID=2733571 RepID=A0A7M1QVM1_9ACTO|nr:hypothetical protein INS88_01105 [Trueperella pecoris]
MVAWARKGRLMAACAVLTLAACASGKTSGVPSASRSIPSLGDVPTVQAFTQAPPFVEPHTRTVIEDVEKLAHPILIYEGKAPAEYELPIVSSRYYALWDTNDVHRASIYERDTGNLVREVSIPNDARRYLGRILFTGTDAFVVDSPDLADRNTETGKISRLDLLTGASTEVAPPAGLDWSYLPETIAEHDGTIVAMAQKPGTREPCLAKIEGTTASAITCWSGSLSDRLSIMPGHVSSLVWPSDDPDLCTQLHLTSLEGKTREMGDRRHCRSYDGVTLHGWDVWSSSDVGVISQSTVYADGSGQHLQLSRKNNQSGSMAVCGEATYWKTGFHSQGKRTYALMRWVPGMENVEMIFRTEPEFLLSPPRCNEGILSFDVARHYDPEFGTRSRIYYLDTRELDRQ